MRYLLIFVVITGLMVVFASIIVGIKSFEGVVTDNPYEQGLRWDEINKRTKELGLIIEVKNKKIRIGENDILISIKKADGGPFNAPSIRLFITRPSTDRYDMEVTAKSIGEDLYRARVDLPIYGYWWVIITEDIEEGMEFKEEIFVEKGG